MNWFGRVSDVLEWGWRVWCEWGGRDVVRKKCTTESMD